ncbi:MULTISPECIES: hypothetical protein [Pseudomonas]|uniref:hypothetical protein n=1 Tax=Pseudomonas migulae TaxID=78543 RepID=UPI0020A154E4|nr:hypothetical protein [Pseudomonas migulae]MCP1519374.1 hypothetical protein [Pseudomonas migulae]
MKDDLMVAFLSEETDLSFTRWKWFCIDNAERCGSYPEFIGRLTRCRQALSRRQSG